MNRNRLDGKAIIKDMLTYFKRNPVLLNKSSAVIQDEQQIYARKMAKATISDPLVYDLPICIAT